MGSNKIISNVIIDCVWKDYLVLVQISGNQDSIGGKRISESEEFSRLSEALMQKEAVMCFLVCLCVGLEEERERKKREVQYISKKRKLNCLCLTLSNLTK